MQAAGRDAGACLDPHRAPRLRSTQSEDRKMEVNRHGRSTAPAHRPGSRRGQHLVCRGARRGAGAEIHHHRHRRRDRRLLSDRRRDLPAGQQGPQGARHPLLRRDHRRLGLQRQHDPRRASSTSASPSRTCSTTPTTAAREFAEPGTVREPALGVLGPSRAVHRGRACRCRHQDLRRPEGQAGQHRQSRARASAPPWRS